jgi:hypothetical protein
MESALAYAATESRARNCEIQVLLASDGSYRAVAADATPKESTVKNAEAGVVQRFSADFQ